MADEISHSGINKRTQEVHMLYSIGTRRPGIEADCFLVPGVQIIGSVVVHAQASVWFGAILRGDNDLIEIGERTNIQDGAVLHTDEGIPLRVGQGVTVGHKAVLHGCEVGDNCLIGIGAVILNQARIGTNCLIGAGALIPEGKEIADNSVVLGAPGRVVREISEKEMARIAGSAEHYVNKSAYYRRQLRELDK